MRRPTLREHSAIPRAVTQGCIGSRKLAEHQARLPCFLTAEVMRPAAIMDCVLKLKHSKLFLVYFAFVTYSSRAADR